VNHFRFFEPDFTKPMKDAYFEFNPLSVKNYRVIDADAPKDGAPAPAQPPAPAKAAMPPVPAPPAPAKK
jgi:hypothetical protein